MKTLLATLMMLGLLQQAIGLEKDSILSYGGSHSFTLMGESVVHECYVKAHVDSNGKIANIIISSSEDDEYFNYYVTSNAETDFPEELDLSDGNYPIISKIEAIELAGQDVTIKNFKLNNKSNKVELAFQRTLDMGIGKVTSDFDLKVKLSEKNSTIKSVKLKITEVVESVFDKDVKEKKVTHAACEGLTPIK